MHAFYNVFGAATVLVDRPRAKMIFGEKIRRLAPLQKASVDALATHITYANRYYQALQFDRYLVAELRFLTGTCDVAIVVTMRMMRALVHVGVP